MSIDEVIRESSEPVLSKPQRSRDNLEYRVRMLEAHPRAVMWTVSHRGAIEIITSDAVEGMG